MALALHLWLLLGLLAARAGAGATVHTVIPTECKSYMTWQSLGMYYSFRRVGQPGGFTRIMCCTKEEYDRLSEAEKTVVPTHWAPSYTVHPRTGDVYHAYNKPLAVYDWLSRVDVKEDYVLVIDADMIMRETFKPEELGAKPGWAVAAYFGYMKGTDNELALKHVPEIIPRNDTLAGRVGRRGDMAGGFTLMYKKDLQRVAPLWLKYTEAVREDPGAWNLTGDVFAKKPGDKPWISEMYGYSFGCAKADVWHITHSEHMLYPGYDTVDPPKVLHYGLLWKVTGTSYEFDKHWHFDFDPLTCPPWNLSPDPRQTKKGLFAHPPAPSSFTTKGFDLLRDLLAVEPVLTLNAAFCERHLQACPHTEELLRECNRANALMVELDAAYRALELPDPCVNRAKECEWWAAQGECEKTAGWMYGHCRLACKWCTPRGEKKEEKPTTPALPEARTQQQQAQTSDAAASGAGQQTAATTQQQQQQAAAATTQQQAQQGGSQADAATTMQGQAAAGQEQQEQQGGEASKAKQEEPKAPEAKGASKPQHAKVDRAKKKVLHRGSSKAGGEGGNARVAAETGAEGSDPNKVDPVIDQHHAAMTERGASIHAKAVQAANGADTKHMPFLASEGFGVHSVLNHHVQMLAGFWGVVLLSVGYKMRRRLFSSPTKRHHPPGRHRLYTSSNV